MRIPYVIDNQDQKLADVLNDQLERFKDRTLDVASTSEQSWSGGARGHELERQGERRGTRYIRAKGAL